MYVLGFEQLGPDIKTFDKDSASSAYMCLHFMQELH